jgi:hypothetical protein
MQSCTEVLKFLQKSHNPARYIAQTHFLRFTSEAHVFASLALEVLADSPLFLIHHLFKR